MSKAQPEVAVGIPVYNGERYLEPTLRALSVQEYENIEFVISDNGSTDGTPELCREYCLVDPRFTYHRSERNRGIPWNYDRVLELSNAPLFMWNAADDIPLPSHIDRCREALIADPRAIIAFSRVQVIDGCGQIVGEFDDLDLDFRSIDGPRRVELFLKRSAYQVIGFGGLMRTAEIKRFTPTKKYYGYDGPLAVSMAMRGPFVQVPELLYQVRSHDWQANKLQGGDAIDQVKAYDPDFKGYFAFPQWRLNAEFVIAAMAGDGSVHERSRAVVAVVRYWTIANWRLPLFDIKRNLQRLRSGQYRGAYWGRGDNNS